MSAGTSGEPDGDQAAGAQDGPAWLAPDAASEPAWMSNQPPSWPDQPALRPGDLTQPGDWAQPAGSAYPDSEPVTSNGTPVSGAGPVPPPPPPGYQEPGQDFAAGQPYQAYPPGQPYPGGPGYPPYGLRSARLNPVAIAALVCGIVQFGLGLFLVLNILGAVPAIVCGAIGMRQTRQRGERGRGLAIAGLVLGILGVLYWVLIIGLIVVVSGGKSSG